MCTVRMTSLWCSQREDPMIGRLTHIVIDCPDPSALAPFYEALLGAARVDDSPDWVTLAVGVDSPHVALQRTDRYVAPVWATGSPPQQMHLDLLVENLNRAQEQVLALGASLLEGSDKPIGYRVYADPVGHPFCLERAAPPSGIRAISLDVTPCRPAAKSGSPKTRAGGASGRDAWNSSSVREMSSSRLRDGGQLVRARRGTGSPTTCSRLAVRQLAISRTRDFRWPEVASRSSPRAK